MPKVFKTLMETGPLIHPGHGAMALLKQARHCLRGIAFARQTRDWFELLQSPGLAGVAHQYPWLFQKLQRPYLNRVLNTGQRLQALQEHYRFVTAAFSPAAMHEVYFTPGKLLATVDLNEVGRFGLRLSCSRLEKEGDLVIGLVDLGTGEVLFTLAFSVTRFALPREIFIGGLQGNKLANNRELIVAITRGMHGLRPKALLLFALQTLAGAWDVNRLHAVSDANHIYRHWQKRRCIAASYDSWWTECGGSLASDGMFDLPAAFLPRPIATLKANKRPLYRQRYAMLSAIAGQIKASQAEVSQQLGGRTGRTTTGTGERDAVISESSPVRWPAGTVADKKPGAGARP